MWSVQSAPQVLSSSQRSVTGSVDQRQNARHTGTRDLPQNIRPLLSLLVRRDRAFGATLGARGGVRPFRHVIILLRRTLLLTHVPAFTSCE